MTLALGVLAASVAIGGLVLTRDEPLAAGDATAQAAAAEAVAPVPPRANALMIAGRSGEILVGLAVGENAPLELRVFGEEEAPLAGGTIRAGIDGAPLSPLPPADCGPACYRLEVEPFTGSPLVVAVEVDRLGRRLERVRLELPARFPQSGAKLLAKAKRTMLALRSVRIEETLSAGARTLRSSWQIEAPNRLRVDASDGGRSVLIGRKRWDLVDGAWRESTWDGARQPWYPWEEAANGRILGERTIAGQRTTRVAAFVSEPEPWWFVLYVTDDGRVLREEMLAPSHFMVDEFSGFNEQVTIEPPA